MYQSQRISLRSFTDSDSKFIAEMRQDFSSVLAAGGRPFPTNESNEKDWISTMYPNAIPTNIYFVIEETKSKEFIGYCSALNINYINRNAHVGFFLHKNARGKGFFKESQILFYAYLFNEINLKKVYSYALEYNHIAIKADKQIGFQVDGVMKEHVFQNGKYHDALMLSLTAEDFFKHHNINEYLI